MLIIKNSSSRFGLISIIFHWLIALLTLSLFGLGVWMVELDYYSVWYQVAPWWHKNVGVCLLVLVLIRWVWQVFSPSPLALSTIPSWQRISAHIVHEVMNILIVFICLAGYFIVTAKGQALSVFDWLHIPATLTGIANLEDIAGDLHALAAYILMVIIGLHVVAALKHHFINKDNTLLRILGK